ncbi:hypothetical protein KC19_7G068300, partial [Ceratodon purpureus]
QPRTEAAQCPTVLTQVTKTLSSDSNTSSILQKELLLIKTPLRTPTNLTAMLACRRAPPAAASRLLSQRRSQPNRSAPRRIGNLTSALTALFFLSPSLLLSLQYSALSFASSPSENHLTSTLYQNVKGN